MFGRRSNDPGSNSPAPIPSGAKIAEVKPAAAEPRAQQQPRQPEPAPAPPPERRHSEEYYDVKTTVFNALIDTIDLSQLAVQMQVAESFARELQPGMPGDVLITTGERTILQYLFGPISDLIAKSMREQ